MNIDQKEQLLNEFFDEWGECERCGLCKPIGRTRRSIVMCDGNPDAKLMVIGEGPGEEEDKTGTPFVGASGTIVDGYITSLGFSRSDVFIANMVACRATEDKDPRKNRTPTTEEINACLPRLYRTIEIVDPFVILFLGGVAYKTISGGKKSLTDMAGDPDALPLVFTTPGSQVPVERLGLVTYHPSYLLQQGSPQALFDKSYRTWRRAFRIANMLDHIYRGETLLEIE